MYLQELYQKKNKKKQSASKRKQSVNKNEAHRVPFAQGHIESCLELLAKEGNKQAKRQEKLKCIRG